MKTCSQSLVNVCLVFLLSMVNLSCDSDMPLSTSDKLQITDLDLVDAETSSTISESFSADFFGHNFDHPDFTPSDYLFFLKQKYVDRQHYAGSYYYVNLEGQDKVRATIAGAETQSDEGVSYVSYEFSSPERHNYLNGVKSIELPSITMHELNFFTASQDAEYRAYFPELPEVHGDILNNTGIISRQGGDEVSWTPQESIESVMHVLMLHTAPQSGESALPMKRIAVDDLGSYVFSPEALADYSHGDLITIALSREVYASMENLLLVRCMEVEFISILAVN